VVKIYAIIVYDVEQKRVGRVCRFLRVYLNWVQNSVFEGEITESKLLEIKKGLKEIVEGGDSVLLFLARSQDWLSREIIGIEKNPTDNVI